uniref:Uncharacterized protein n=1 Tax=Chrysotila carterae TaxID=13221 RepID=A0A7S4BWT0_CHRCT
MRPGANAARWTAGDFQRAGKDSVQGQWRVPENVADGRLFQLHHAHYLDGTEREKIAQRQRDLGKEIHAVPTAYQRAQVSKLLTPRGSAPRVPELSCLDEDEVYTARMLLSGALSIHRK